MTNRCQFENSNDIGVFAKLTNGYCLVSIGASYNFYSVLESELGSHIPIIQTTIGGSKIVGRTTSGNKKGLLVPNTITDSQLRNIRTSLPENIKIKRIEEKMSALGNCIACNDHIAFIHPDLDKQTQQLIADTLAVQVFRTTIANTSLVGTYCSINNKGGLVHPHTTIQQLDQLANLLQLPICSGTVNRGSQLIGAGLIVNDWAAFCGQQSTATQIQVIDSIFKLQKDI